MEKKMTGEMRTKREVSHVCLLFLTLLQITTFSSALHPVSPIATTTTTITTTTTTPPNTAALSYRTRPADVLVAVGEPAVFCCGVPEASPNLTFIFHSSHGNYSLTCPYGHVEDIPQEIKHDLTFYTRALSGSCDMKDGESMAVWTLKGTSFSDNGTRVVCQQSENPDAPAAVLRLYDNGTSYATLIGCTIGGFFGILLVLGLSYAMLQGSGNFQKCFRGKETEDDMTTIVTKD